MRNPEPLLYYKWYWRDHRASRNVQRLSSLERGLHRELLDAQWEHGFIPDDLEKLAGICDCPVEVMREAWPNIRRCYEPCESDPAKLINPRMERERERSDAKRAKLAKAGLQGIIARIHRENEQYRSANAPNAQPPDTPDFQASDWCLRTLKTFPSWLRQELEEPPEDLLELYLDTLKREAPERGGILQAARWLLGRVEEYARRHGSQSPEILPYIGRWLEERRYLAIELPAQKAPGELERQP